MANRNTTYDNDIRKKVIEGLNARQIYIVLNMEYRVRGLPDVISQATVYRRYIEYMKIYRPWELIPLPHEELFRTNRKTKVN